MYISRGARPDNAVPPLPFYGMHVVTSAKGVAGPSRSIMRVIFADFRHCDYSVIKLSLFYETICVLNVFIES